MGALALTGSEAFTAGAGAPGLRGAVQAAQSTASTASAPSAAGASSVLPLAAAGAVAAVAGRAGRKTRSSVLPTFVPVKESSVTRRALDQSSRYADLSLDEATLIKNGKHVLVAYIMKPKAGYDYLATAAHFAAESSTGTNVNVCTTDDFTKSVDALVYYIDPDNEEMKIAYPNLLFDRNIIDGRGMMCSFLTLAIGNNQGSLLAPSGNVFA
ncbi:unnamed protein product [Effrenium voratum]|uniref:Ribulose bisphosphate carboxylase large subunit ferrodoxin-like N-terminal domain-containing protein n=1 Tax=Effrenium voratum TaxID=2562239 RepID=A0AA36N1A6_9DINO|nr:unnamed protein product [Effrenium voratum]